MVAVTDLNTQAQPLAVMVVQVVAVVLLMPLHL
jgi:hypothetical protein